MRSKSIDAVNNDDLIAIERENHKLRKINKVLMDRVERDMDCQGSAFSLFQTAIMLENKVVERTTELTGLTHRLMHEISERTATEESLRELKAAAERANSSKTKFLAAAGHDLFQPLNAARIFLAALANSRQTRRNAALVDRIESAFVAVDDLLNALLDISKLDAGTWSAQPSDFAVGSLLERLAAEYEPQAAARGLELRCTPCSAVLRTDRHLLERILRNFISNAIRYTKRGRILLGCRRLADHLSVEVWDTGIGIAEDKLALIFGEFYRLGSGPRGNDKGFGLGLAIVDRIAKLLKLNITVRSRPGVGSGFGVAVPLGDEIAAKTERAMSRRQANPTGVAGKEVMVVDSHPETLQAIAALLGSWKCLVQAAASPEDALARFERAGRPPDLIIVGQLRDDGMTAIETMAMAPAGQVERIPTIVLSRDNSPGARHRIEAQGCHFLARPVNPAKLGALASHLLCQTAKTPTAMTGGGEARSAAERDAPRIAG